MTAFKSTRDYFKFRQEAVKSRRYIRSAESDAFLEAVASSCHARAMNLDEGAGLKRAQIAHAFRPITSEDPSSGEQILVDEVECEAPKSRMMPLRDRAGDGRVNPRGIPCLYMATNEATAVSEVRPAIGAFVTVATMKCMRRITLVDCSQLVKQQLIYLKEPEQEKIVEAVWSDIDRAFSTPANRSDDAAEYAPTQIIAEMFKSLGYDGVAYKSAFGEDGYNVAVFKIDDFEVANCRLFEVKDISHKINQVYS